MNQIIHRRGRRRPAHADRGGVPGEVCGVGLLISELGARHIDHEFVDAAQTDVFDELRRERGDRRREIGEAGVEARAGEAVLRKVAGVAVGSYGERAENNRWRGWRRCHRNRLSGKSGGDQPRCGDVTHPSPAMARRQQSGFHSGDVRVFDCAQAERAMPRWLCR
jgi:hypothetical protein